MPLPAPELPTPAVTLAPAQAPKGATLGYAVKGRVKGLDYQASGELVWENLGDRYRAKLEVGAFLMGSRTQISEGQLSDRGLLPGRFEDQTRRSRATEFDRESGKVRYSRTGQERPLELGTQDSLSISLQLGALIKANPAAYPPGSTIVLPVADSRETVTWVFQIKETKPVRVETGEVPAIEATLQPGPRQTNILRLWFSPELDYLLVKLRLEKPNGDFLEQVLNSVQ